MHFQWDPGHLTRAKFDKLIEPKNLGCRACRCQGSVIQQESGY